MYQNQATVYITAKKVLILDPGGTYCYRPFYKGFRVYRNSNGYDDNNNSNFAFNSNDTNSNSNNNVVFQNENDRNEVSNENVRLEGNNRLNLHEIFQHRIVPTDEARRRLYIDLNRPRPFYGRTGGQNRPLQNVLEVDVQDDVRHSDPMSLQVNILTNSLKSLF